MNIRDLYGSANRPDQIRNGSVAGMTRSEPVESERTRPVQPVSPVRDRVEISDAARSAAADREKARELDFARKALQGIPPLSDDRAADILKRIQEGYYNQPEVIDTIANKIVSDLTSDQI